MSLLQEAIRRAERARDEAQRPAKRAELSSVPLEIVAEPEAPPASQPLAVEPGWAFEPSAPAEPPRAESAAPEAAELSASEPKRAFHVVLALIGVAAVAIAAYFWIQLRPVPVVAKPSPHRAVAAVQVAPAPPAAEPATHPGNVLLPGLPPSVPPEPSRPEPSRPAASAPAAKPTAKPQRVVSEPAPLRPRPPSSSPVARAAPAIHPRVQSGYVAYQAGDLLLARAEYQEALRDDA